MKLRIYLITIVLFFRAGSLFGQTAEECLKKADSFLTVENYEEAANLYRRLIFFDTLGHFTAQYFNLAECLFFSKNYDEALFYYQVAYQNTTSLKLANDILFRRAMIFFLKNELLEASRELYQVDTFEDTGTIKRYYFYQGLIAYRNGLFDSSRQLFIQSLSLSSDSIKINNIFRSKAFNGKPSPKTAQFLSMIIPGLGQLYAGDMKNAVNSFVLNAILGTVFLYISQKYSLTDAILSVLPWFQRYYFGGFNRAKQIALLQQERKKQKALSEILMVFESEKN